MNRILSLLIAAILPTLTLAQLNEHKPADSFDVVHYDVSIDFDLRHHSFRGSVGVTSQALESLHGIDLNASNETLTIDSVFSDDMKMEFTHSSQLLTVDFPEAVPTGTQFEVSIFYHGISIYDGEYDGGGIYFISDTRLATISEPNFARMWWPSKDRPSDKATAHITITVPESLTAVSNGILKEVRHKNGKATFVWETNYPIATYLVSMAVAQYQQFSETYTGLDGTQMPVTNYAYPEDLQPAMIDFQNTVSILKFFSSTFREYPFLHEKFGNVEVDGNTTMEHQTICSIQKSMITGKRTEELTFVHETAHHWWGDFITPLNWKHTWLSEGFATYAEALYLESTAGKDSANRYIKGWMGEEQGIYAGSVIGKTDTAFWDSFAPRVYNKGALVLHMLRGVVGDSLFFAAMKGYLNNPALAYGNAQTEDFVKECEKASGRSLRWFFDEWVYSSPDSIDRPEYVYSWDTRPDQGKHLVTLRLEQATASKLLYRMPITITLVSRESRTHRVVTDSLASQSFSFTSDVEPTDLLVDNENMIMKILRKQGNR